MRKSQGTRRISWWQNRRRTKASIAVAAVVGALLPVALLAAAPSANASIPAGIGFTQEGCNNPGGLVLPNGSGDFICPDADYTTGNLGMNWSELDLVPFRVTVSAGNSAASSSTFSFAVAVDNTDSGVTGFDVLSAPVLNTTLSAASCSAATVGAQTTANGQLLRLVTVTVHQNTDCIYDYYARLAIGAHNYPGSSLHANLADDLTGSTSGIGTKAVSINPKELAPQSISKTMTATQDSDHVWDVVKSPTPASLSFTNTCDPSLPLSAGVAITVSWTKEPATPSGDVTVVTHVYANNPSTRVITVSISDQLYSGTTAIGSPVTAGPTDVPANTASFLVLDDTTTVPAGTADLNDIATATYTDTVTGVPVPGTTTATASATVQSSGVVNNDSATITDVESITGTGLTFSTDSVSGASGAFDGGYVAGTKTTGPVSWTSDTLTADSGSITFNKTVYASAATVDSTGGLSDTATLTGSEGFTTHDDLTVDVTTDATTSLTVTKDSTIALASQKTYTFHLLNGSNVDLGQTTTVTLPAGSTGPVTSDPITGLSPTGTYKFHEDASAPFAAQTSSPVTFSLVAGDVSTCSANIDMTNSAGPAHARVQKITDPTSSGDWTFTLTGPNSLSETLSTVTANAGYFSFAHSLDVDGGTYTITETQQSGYDLTSVTGDINGNTARVSHSTSAKTCSFTLDLTTDSDQTFSCTFTNTLRGHVKVIKTVNGNPPSGSQAFTFQLRSGASTTQAGTILETLTANAGNGGVLNFTTDLVPGQTYQLCEQLLPGWTTNLGPPLFTVYMPSGDNSVVCTDFTVTPGQLLVFNIDNTPPPGGTALTIGYWRNWSSCTAGKQKPVLDQKLLAAANAGNPFTLGLLVLDPNVLGRATACKDAVNILSKRNLNGVNKAKDALFNMAAQLLAADLNVFSGAATCAAETTAANQAHALLTKYHFDGLTHTTVSAADVNLAHTLAGTLDQYNNNLLC